MAPLNTQLKLYAYYVLVLCALKIGGPHNSFAAPIDKQVHGATTCTSSRSLLISLMHKNASCSSPGASVLVPSKQLEFLNTTCNVPPCNLDKLRVDLCANSDTLISKSAWLTKNDTTCQDKLRNWCSSVVSMPNQESIQDQTKEPCFQICELKSSEASGPSTLCDILNTMIQLFKQREEYLKQENLDMPSNKAAKENDSNIQAPLASTADGTLAPSETEIPKSPDAAVEAVPSKVDAETQHTSKQTLPLAESDVQSTQIRQEEMKSNASAVSKPVSEPQSSNATSEKVEKDPVKNVTPVGEIPAIVSPVSPDAAPGHGNAENEGANIDSKVPISNQLESSSGSSQNADIQSKVTDALAETRNAADTNDNDGEIPVPNEEKQTDYSDYPGDDDKRVGEPDVNENKNIKSDTDSDQVRKEPVKQTQPQSQAPQENEVTFLRPNDDEESESGYIGYFITLVGFFGICFLLLHNKNRILAFVIEGRRPNPGRRRSTTSYRKLENNFD